MKIGNLIVIAALTLAAPMAFLAGCASVSMPVDVASVWTPPKDAQKPDETWKNLRDYKVEFSNVMTLAELSDTALRKNPASRKAWYDASVAAAQVKQAEGYFMPSITATAGGTQQSTKGNPNTFNQVYTTYGPGLQVNYLVINFGGGRGAAVEEALQTVYALDFTFNRSIQNILLAVESAYYNVISAQAAIEAVETSATDAKTTLDAAQERQKQGLGTELDILQSQAAYDQALFNLAGAQGQLKIARGNLAQAIGVPADTDVKLSTPTNDLPETLSEVDMRGLIDNALDRRPDISSLRASLAAKRAAVVVVGSEQWPSLYLNGALSRNYYDFGSQTVTKEFPDRDVTYNAGLNLQWTLFDGFQTLNAKRAAEAQAESAEAQLEQAELAASADVWTSYRNYETAIEKHRFSMAYLKSSSAAYDLALESYKAGIKGFLDLLTAESQLAQARSQDVATRQEVLLALVNLAYSTGLLEDEGSTQANDISQHEPLRRMNRP
jgi:outer membrane protein TolC